MSWEMKAVGEHVSLGAKSRTPSDAGRCVVVLVQQTSNHFTSTGVDRAAKDSPI